MAAMLETPSRVWKRIEAVEGQDLPSLPSLPGFDESSASDPSELDDGPNNILSPMHSTPAVTPNQHTILSAARLSSGMDSVARFASSIASRSNKSALQSMISSRRASTAEPRQDSFDISKIASLPNISAGLGKGQEGSATDDEHSGSDNVSDLYLPLEEDEGGVEKELSLTDALQSVSRSSSPALTNTRGPETTPKKYYDYSISLKSEPKPSPIDKYRNVAIRKSKSIARTRTPSLSRTSSSRASSPSHSTPQSSISISLPQADPQSPTPSGSVLPPLSSNASPIAQPPPDREVDDISEDEDGYLSRETNARSMDITDVHISPPYIDRDQSISSNEGPGMENNAPLNEQSDSVSDQSSESAEKRHHHFNGRGSHSPEHPVSTLTSPGQSVAFTPTPMYPRPRARLNIPISEDMLKTPNQSEPGQLGNDSQGAEDEGDLLTPHTRRRSFLLSIINSTARPRMKLPTPHPRNLNFNTPSVSESTPASGLSTGPRMNLQTAFAGVTPRPRPGMARNPRSSHPLSQAFVPSPGESDSESGASGSGIDSRRRQSVDQWTVAAKNPSSEGASFVSTASSHDLTTHHRANTSFDPAMGFGAGAGQGVGRFNAGKLNNYLHGLNRRLQEENEALIERLKKLERDKRAGTIESSALEGGRRLSGGRRVSAGSTVLGNVAEEIGAEGWGEEKAQLEDLIEALEEEKEELQQKLQAEKDGRIQDREEWRKRMVEVEEGVSGIIKDLEEKVTAAERHAREVEEKGTRRFKDLTERLAETEAERNLATERAEKAERVLESGRELGGELRDANEQIGKLSSELRKAQGHVKELEENVVQSDHKIDDLEKDLREDRDAITNLEKELLIKDDELATDRTQVRQMEEELQLLEQDLRATRSRLTEMEEGAVAAVERIETLEEELASASYQIRGLAADNEEAQDKVEKLEQDAQKAQELARQMDHALEEAEKKTLADDQELNTLKGKLASAERERAHRLSGVSLQSSRDSLSSSREVEEMKADVGALENELEEAAREIARLNTLLSLSPARKALEKAKDTKMEMLEQEKEELLERNRALRVAMNEINTPSKIINASGISPIHRHVLSLSLRAPKTPGAPLRDMSWLNDLSSDPSHSPLVTEISRLQRELDRANNSIDDKLDKLEDAGLSAVELTKKFEDARAKISTLEDELTRLSRREERRFRYLQRAKCEKCGVRVSLSALIQADDSLSDFSRIGDMSGSFSDARKADTLRTDAQTINVQLEAMKKSWDQERQMLLGEKAVLQDVTNRLNSEVRNIREEMKKATENGRAGEKAAASVQVELDKAKSIIVDLEANLKSERAQLRALTTEQHRVQRDKTDILNQLKRTESDMEDVKQKLHHYKEENRNLEDELRDNLNAEQKARLLEGRVIENAATIDNLREERSLLAADYKELQRRLTEVTEQAHRLRATHDASSTSHENRRHQLDLYLLEIDDLRLAVSNQADELKKAGQEKQRMSAEKSEISRTVAALEADLRRVKKDAEAFGRDLKLLRAEKEKQEEQHQDELSSLHRSGKQAHTQIRLLKEKLDDQYGKTELAKEEIKNHVCQVDGQLLAMKVQHNKECKGLIVQIRYLKAKFTRESSFRVDLSYQKKYLLVLMAQFEKSEQTIFAAISQIGFPISLPPQGKKLRTFKSIAVAVVFISRARNASNGWREHVEEREAVNRALLEVRRRRTQSS